jgi:geranylgeranyl pyrophosphate synthase
MESLCESRSELIGRFLDRYNELVNNIPSHIHTNLLEFSSGSPEKLSKSENLLKSQKQIEEISKYNFKLDSKLMRPKILLGFAFLIAEANGDLNEEFFESETFNRLQNWTSVCEMIHNSSLIHVNKPSFKELG